MARRAAATPALAALDDSGILYTTHTYTAPGRAASGTEAAEALGLDPERVLKTLVAEVDGRPVLAMVPVAGTLDLKALAAARGAKRAVMADPAVAERLTGYVVGGIAPLGTRHALDVVVDLSVAEHGTVYCSAGRRGLQMELAPTTSSPPPAPTWSGSALAEENTPQVTDDRLRLPLTPQSTLPGTRRRSGRRVRPATGRRRRGSGPSLSGSGRRAR